MYFLLTYFNLLSLIIFTYLYMLLITYFYSHLLTFYLHAYDNLLLLTDITYFTVVHYCYLYVLLFTHVLYGHYFYWHVSLYLGPLLFIYAVTFTYIYSFNLTSYFPSICTFTYRSPLAYLPLLINLTDFPSFIYIHYFYLCVISVMNLIIVTYTTFTYILLLTDFYLPTYFCLHPLSNWRYLMPDFPTDSYLLTRTYLLLLTDFLFLLNFTYLCLFTELYWCTFTNLLCLPSLPYFYLLSLGFFT